MSSAISIIPTCGKTEVPADPEGKRAAVEASLWKWNVWMGILHLIQGILVLAISLSQKNAKNFTIPMYTSMPVWTMGFPTIALQFRGTFPFVGVTSGFAFMSAAAHFIVLFYFKKYLADLRLQINVFRWYEYAVSSSLMIILIAMLFGVWDPILLTVVAAVNACMNLFGLLHERMNAGRAPSDINWEPFAFGCFAGVVPWCVILAYLASSPSLNLVPGFVWGILCAYAVMFNTFPINMVLQYKQVGWWSDSYWGFPQGGYLFGERMYQVQSLVSKSLLLWLVTGGANQPNQSTAGGQ